VARKKNDSARIAVELAEAISRIRLRLREEAGLGSTGLSLSQVRLLGRITREQPTTAASLANAEHVSQQAIAQTLTPLKKAGLIKTRSDPSDGRKTLVEASAAGTRLREGLLNSRDAWLVRAIDATVPPGEKKDLEKAAALLARLAEADV
jgi:DNA-binding MarR family transcriptional regulator